MLTRNEQGFTIIELLMAMALFSFVLLIIASGFISIVKLQQSGQASRTTGQDVRYGIEEMVRDVRSGSDIDYPTATTPSTGVSILCVRNTVGSVTEFYVAPDGKMMKNVLADCNSVGPSGGTAISSTNVVVKDFNVKYVAGDPASVTMSLSIGVNNGSVFTGSGSTQSCDLASSGSQYCSLTTIKSAATPRGGF